VTERGIRVRFAPSPSGDLHVGNIRTALYDWAFARATRGTFVLRIEDTDATRVRPEYIASAQDTLRWLGLDWDEGPGVGGPFGPYLQSERLGRYAEWVDRFLADGHAYYCYCTPEELQARREAAREAGGPSGYDGHCRHLTAEQVAEYVAEGRRPVVRFLMPEGSTTFTDLVRGEVTFDHAHVPDFVLARADGRPLYTLAVAVDDVLMEITHVVRGEDLLSSTPRQIAVYGAMGVPADRFPAFAHLPYVLGPNGQRLSKRNGVVSINWYREHGFLAEAICNYLALLGWSPGENREEFTMAEMAAEFDLARVNKNSALIQTRIRTLREAPEMLGFLFGTEAGFHVNPADAESVLVPESVPVLTAAQKALTGLGTWSRDEIERVLWAALITGLGLKRRVAFIPVYVAVTGHRIAPPLFDSIELLGREKTLDRLTRAVRLAEGAA